MNNFQQLKVWQKAHELTLSIYRLTTKLPKEELFGLVSQIRRACVSVESNIAEGEGRYSRADKINFFIASRASINEVQTQLLIIRDLFNDFASEARILFEEYNSLGLQLNKLITYRRTYAK